MTRPVDQNGIPAVPLAARLALALMRAEVDALDADLDEVRDILVDNKFPIR